MPQSGDNAWSNFTFVTTQSNNQTLHHLPKTPLVSWGQQQRWLPPSPCLVHSLAVEKKDGDLESCGFTSFVLLLKEMPTC